MREPSESTNDELGRRRPGRRAVVAGAAWSLPVMVSAPAPALAASLCPVIPVFATPAWTLTTAGLSVAGTGSATFSGGSFRQSLDARNGSTFVATASRTLPVVAGVTYTFLMPFTAYVINTRPMRTTLQVNGVNLPGAPHVDTALLAVNSGTTNHVGTRTASYVATTTGLVTLSVRTEITSPSSGSTAGDDMVVNALTVTCR